MNQIPLLSLSFCLSPESRTRYCWQLKQENVLLILNIFLPGSISAKESAFLTVLYHKHNIIQPQTQICQIVTFRSKRKSELFIITNGNVSRQNQPTSDMKYRVPRCLYSRAEGWSWIALVRSFTASLIRPRGDRIYKPKNVIKGEIFQWSTPKLPTFLTFQFHFTTLHSQDCFLSGQDPWPHILHSKVQSQQAEAPWVFV